MKNFKEFYNDVTRFSGEDFGTKVIFKNPGLALASSEYDVLTGAQGDKATMVGHLNGSYNNEVEGQVDLFLFERSDEAAHIAEFRTEAQVGTQSLYIEPGSSYYTPMITADMQQLINNKASFSLAFWSKITDYRLGTVTLFSIKGNGEDDSEFFFNVDGEHGTGLFEYSTGYDEDKDSFTLTADNEWKHIAFTFDEPTRIMKLYINGTLKSEVTVTNYTNTIDDDATYTWLIINKLGSGYVDEIVVWKDVALTDAEINDLYTRQLYKYSDETPYVIVEQFTGNIKQYINFIEQSSGDGAIGYKFSIDNGAHWRIIKDGIETFTTLDNKDELMSIDDFNAAADLIKTYTDRFKLAIYFISDGSQYVEIDYTQIDYAEEKQSIENKRFYDIGYCKVYVFDDITDYRDAFGSYIENGYYLGDTTGGSKVKMTRTMNDIYIDASSMPIETVDENILFSFEMKLVNVNLENFMAAYPHFERDSKRLNLKSNTRIYNSDTAKCFVLRPFEYDDNSRDIIIFNGVSKTNFDLDFNKKNLQTIGMIVQANKAIDNEQVVEWNFGDKYTMDSGNLIDFKIDKAEDYEYTEGIEFASAKLKENYNEGETIQAKYGIIILEGFLKKLEQIGNNLINAGVKYQISNDGGASWWYYNREEDRWYEALDNTVGTYLNDINYGMNSFFMEGTKNINFKAILNRVDGETPVLKRVKIYYEAD